MEGLGGVEQLDDLLLVKGLFLGGGESPVMDGLVGLHLEEVALLAQLLQDLHDMFLPMRFYELVGLFHLVGGDDLRDFHGLLGAA